VSIFRKLKPQSSVEMPAGPGSFWAFAGPGALLVGLSIGAGEIIIWPRIVAEYGAGMAWAALLGVFLQLWVNLEVGRWTIATGETVFTGYSRIWRGFGPVFILLTVLAWIAPGWGLASGLALKALIFGPGGPGSNTLWTVITFAGIAGILLGPRVAYKGMERTVEALVVIVTLGLIITAVAVGTTEHWGAMGAGLLNVGHKAPGMSVALFFSAIVFAGAGGTANLFYSFYLRDKNAGMGSRIPIMTNPLHGRHESVASAGYTFEDTDRNRFRFQAWWRYLVKDQILFFWALNSVTILLFMFGALAVLHPEGIIPAKGSLIWDEAAVLGKIWGGPGRTIFLAVGFATLFSTQLTLLDGVSRTLSDIMVTNFSFGRKREVGWWYVVTAGVWIASGCLITWVLEAWQISELGFLLNAAYMGGFAMAIYTPLNLYMNHKYLPVSARPGIVCTVMGVIISAIYIGFALYCLASELVTFSSN
jgi:hypothetical protein